MGSSVYSLNVKNVLDMDVACCSTCDGHVTNRHSRCQGGPWNERLRRPNYISGYTGKIPINLRWDGLDNPWETRDFHSACQKPGKIKSTKNRPKVYMAINPTPLQNKICAS